MGKLLVMNFFLIFICFLIIKIFSKKDEKFQIKNLFDITPTEWSGGKTFELYIGGKNKNYKERSFLCRVSSATVELETSTFTDLPKYNRYITTLEGDMKLEHYKKDKESIEKSLYLEPFDVHFFDGGIKTVSYGKVRDFNLMIEKDTTNGIMKSYDLYKSEFTINEKGKNAIVVLFVAEGQVTITNTQQVLNKYDFIVDENENKMNIFSLGSSKLIVCYIYRDNKNK